MSADSASLPPVPLTLEGSAVLHQMMRLRWSAWKPLPSGRKADIVEAAAAALRCMEQNACGRSALFSVLGHKSDLLLVHFRESFDQLKHAELQLTRLELSDYLEPVHSYVSVVELGLYESTAKVYGALAERGIEPHSPEWKPAVYEV